jgi:transmembrane sensor
MARFTALLDGYINNRLSEEELAEFLALLEKNDTELEDRLFEELHVKQNSLTTPELRQLMFENVMEQARKPKVYRLWPRVAAAASIVILLGTAIYFLTNKTTTEKPPVAKTNQPTDMAPGSDKAVLTLANGTQIVLTDLANGEVAREGAVAITKQDGQITYSGTAASTEIAYNTITTPRTGKYFLMLADGTKVWLDAATSFTYPASFTSKERNVQLSGQAYFEVAHSAAKPFKVHINTPSGDGGDVQVLGTHFNIMAYGDEPSIKTTLLEGSVKVMNGGKVQLLAPGQQTDVKGGSIQLIKDADVEQAVAWKNGLFQYKRSDIETIMRQAIRWYGVEVEYRGKITDKFSGQISRSVNLSQLLKILEETGRVKFEVKDKKVIASPAP